MYALKIRKNFIFDKAMVEQAKVILKKTKQEFYRSHQSLISSHHKRTFSIGRDRKKSK